MSLTSHNPPPPAHWPLPSDVWPLASEGSTDIPVCANPHPQKLLGTDKNVCATLKTDSSLLTPSLNPSAPSPRPAGHPSPTGRGDGGEGEQSVTLLEGYRLLLQFLVEQEADYLCGARLRARSDQRANYRLGYYRRKQRTPIGRFPLRVPHLLYFVPRVPIVKRATRLAPQILDTLSRILTGSVTGSGGLQAAGRGEASPPTPPVLSPLPLGEAGVRVLEEHAAHLIRTLWTLDLPDDLLAALAEKLTPILGQWRAPASAPTTPQL